MKRKSSSRLWLLTLLPLLALSAVLVWLHPMASPRAQAASVQVAAHVEYINGRGIYTYQVTNFGGPRVAAFRIGCAQHVLQLTEAPRMWDFFTGFPPSSVTSPQGWSANVITEEENDKLALEWATPDDEDAMGIEVGQTLTGFSVDVPSESDDAYLFGSWTADLGDGTTITGTLTQF